MTRTEYARIWRKKNAQHYRDYQREYRRKYRAIKKAEAKAMQYEDSK